MAAVVWPLATGSPGSQVRPAGRRRVAGSALGSDLGLGGPPRHEDGSPGGTELQEHVQVMATPVMPWLQCGGGALRALLGSAGPVWARFALLLHPVSYCLLAVEAVPSRVPPSCHPSPVSF